MATNPVTEYSWEDVAKHTSRQDGWLVIDGNVYDVTNWAKKHPGGSRILFHYAGQDATVSTVNVS